MRETSLSADFIDVHGRIAIDSVVQRPFDDDRFDVIVSCMTFEHKGDATFVSDELRRVLLRSGGPSARMPNSFSTVRTMSGPSLQPVASANFTFGIGRTERRKTRVRHFAVVSSGGLQDFEMS